MKKLKDKVAVVYGDGNIGGAISIAFAREGAKIFLAGRTSAKLKTIAGQISDEGGEVELAQVDALREQSVEMHIDEVVKNAGRVDISFNTIGLPMKGIQGIPLTALSLESFSLPISTYLQSHFITSKAAARQMVKQ